MSHLRLGYHTHFRQFHDAVIDAFRESQTLNRGHIQEYFMFQGSARFSQRDNPSLQPSSDKMQYWRSFLSFFTFLIAFATLSQAFPTPNGPAALEARSPEPAALEARCWSDACYKAQQYPLPDIIADIKVKISVVVDEVKTYKTCTAEDIRPHIQKIKIIFKEACDHIQAYIDAQVDVAIILGGKTTDQISVLISAVLDIIVDLTNFCLSIAVKVSINAVISIFADLVATIQVFLNLCVSITVGLSVSLQVYINAFLSLCVNVLGITISL
ncbi:hypothetical protein VNI00_007109 [Paramarasmius palmivorus]|uniref:Uncharacterized protein n=1 Tax=Paramarasmius palmivorus TaxID=297713 RepID=A0AAW0D323_9AGAR